MNGKFLAPAAFPRGKTPRYPLDKRLGGPPCQSGLCVEEKNLALPEIEPEPSRCLSRDSSVVLATGYGLEDQGDGSSSPSRVKNFHFSISSRPALGCSQPPIKRVPGLFPGGKAEGA
jgi:hypothetical protein